MASIDDDQKIVCLLRLAIITFNIVGEEARKRLAPSIFWFHHGMGSPSLVSLRSVW